MPARAEPRPKASSRPFAAFAIGAYALASAASLSDCTASSTPPLVTGAPSVATLPWTGPLPEGVPDSCSGMTYLLINPTASGVAAGRCGGGVIWLECNGAVYSDYSCTDPGTTWTAAAPAQDASVTASGDAEGGSNSSSPSGAATSDGGVPSSGGSSGLSSGASTGASSGASTGASSGASTGASSGASTGASSGG